MTTFADGVYQYGGMPLLNGIPPFLSRYGKTFYVDPVNGSDGNSGQAPNRAFATLYRAHEMMTSGSNDVCFLIGNGAASGTARLSTALAQGVDSSATSGKLTWSKSACHLIGVAAPGAWSRARIATPTGTYTQATFNDLNMILVSGSGCYFSNLTMYQSFSTGANGEICLKVTGDYNVFNNCAVLGMASALAAAGANSRSLVLDGGDDNLFVGCDIGLDTVTRSAANASLGLATGAARNRFKHCTFPIMTSNAGALGILGSGAACCDRFTLMEDCTFINAVDSSSTQMTVLGSFTSASPGGNVVFRRSAVVGATKWGDTNFLANSLVDNAGGAATDGLMVNPS